jgi:hypothetical protein
MKGALVRFLETLFVWTVGPILLFLFEKRLARVRNYTLAGAGILGAAWWSGLLIWLVGVVVGLVPDGHLGPDLAPRERAALWEVLGQTVDADSPTGAHTRRMEERAGRFAQWEVTPVGAVRAAVILHDAMRDKLPRLSPEERFCAHGETGAANALRALRRLERSPWFSVVVADAVLRHMGPCGFNPDWREKRWLSRQCDRRYAAPVSRVSRVVYDLDMLDQASLAGVIQHVTQRQARPGNRESLKESLRTGPDSALKRVSDAAQTLQTRGGKNCGRLVVKHTTSFIRSVDLRDVKTAEELVQAARVHLAKSPEPPCWAAPASADVPVPLAEDGP